ncbi:MAG: transcriptional regulator [Actinobacteria bacterium]|nr:transcriptional regulator [Actinomycetota bacterium]
MTRRDRQPITVIPGAATVPWEHLSQFFADERAVSAETVLRLSCDWRTTDPPQIQQPATGRRVGLHMARTTTERTDALRRMDDFLGGGDLHDLVRRELRATVEVVRDASYSEQTGRALLAAVGELAQLAGWVTSDHGLHAAASRYYLGGVIAAHAARDAPLAGNLLSSLAYQVANVGDPRDAVLLASTAFRGAQATATHATRAVLLERLAWANARLGDHQMTIRLLGEVDEVFASSTPVNEPQWLYWLNRDEIDIMAGRCLVQLRAPRRAVELLTAALDRYDDAHAREKSLYLSWLAEAHLHDRNVEASADVALRALRLGASVASSQSLDRIRHLRCLLRPHRDNKTAAAFDAESSAVLRAEHGKRDTPPPAPVGCGCR